MCANLISGGQLVRMQGQMQINNHFKKCLVPLGWVATQASKLRTQTLPPPLCPRLGSYFLTVKGLEASQPASATQLESVIEQDSEVREAFHKELQNLL